MSEDATAPISRKEKRAQRDAERASKFQREKKKKVKVDESAEAEQKETDGAEAKDELQKDFIALPGAEGTQASAQDAGESKKRKRSQNQEQEGPADQDASAPADAAAPKKKKRKAKAAGEDGEKQPPANQRFIVFVGNLPYSTTDVYPPSCVDPLSQIGVELLLVSTEDDDHVYRL